MPFDANRIEVERIRNLIIGFGWMITNEQITDDKIIVTMEKKRVTPVEEMGVGAD